MEYSTGWSLNNFVVLGLLKSKNVDAGILTW